MRRFHCAGFALIMFLARPSSATAQPAAWNGGNGNWSTPGQWTPAVVPDGPTFDVTIAAAGAYTVTLDSMRTANTFTLNNASATLLVTGGQLTLNTSATLTDGIISLSSGTIVGGSINAGAGRIRATSSFNNVLDGVSLGTGVLDLTPSSSRIRFTNGTNFSNTGTVALGISSQFYLAETVTTPSGVNFSMASGSLISADGFTATLGAASSATPTISVAASSNVTIGAGFFNNQPNSVLVNQGQISFAGANSTLTITTSGTGSGLQNAGIIQATAALTTVNVSANSSFSNSGALRAVNGGTIAIADTAAFSNFNSGALTGGTYEVFAGSVINLNNRVITTSGPSTTLLLDGASSVFTAANTVATNNGSFTISNGRQHTVATFTNNGMLTVGTTSGDLAKLSANVQVNNGGVLRGTGTVEGSVTVASGGTLAPGASPGILTVIGPVTLTAGANFVVDLSGAIAGSGYSQVALNSGGSANLNNATLTTTLNYAPSIGDTFTIITGGTVTGTFAGLPQGATVNLGTFMGTPYTATIAYNATSVVLTVPEPTCILAACSAVGAIVAGIRARRRTALPPG